MESEGIDNSQYEYIPQYSGGVPIPQRSDRADLLDKIKPEQMVEVIRHRLLGEEWIEGTWREVPALKDRKLTPIGAWEVANLMLGVSSINISISNMDEQSINKRAKEIAYTLQKMLVGNWKKYGLSNTSQQWLAHQIVFSNTLAVLKQSGDASIQELMKATVSENRMVSSEKKEGMGSRIKRALGM